MNNRRRQRTRGRGPKFTDRELWALDTTLARVIAAGLRQFIAMKRYGYSAETPEKWEDVLHELLWVFTEIAHDYPSDPHTIWFDKEYTKLSADPSWQMFETEELPDGSHQVTKWHFPPMPAEVTAAQDAYQKRIKAGIKLFAEHFQALGD